MLAKLLALPLAVKQYMLITANYWTFTLTDGALRMLVVLYFHQLGYSPINIAMLFLFYEFFGVVTNLVGGWLGARIGLNKTMNIGLALQILALVMLAVPSEWLTVLWVMVAQALSGVAKDLNKMSAKSSIKLLVKNENNDQGENKLFKWVALLTGSKNTLKGVGFFLGGVLLTAFGFQHAVLIMAFALCCMFIISLLLLKGDIGKTRYKAKFTQLFSKDVSLNYLSAARLFLFASRDVWFVIALPIYLASQLQWQHGSVGALLASWVIFYGVVQAKAPQLLRYLANQFPHNRVFSAEMPAAKKATYWAFILAFATLFMCLSTLLFESNSLFIVGLFIFGFIFAINSSLHSYLVVAFARDEGVSMDVGFYYMSNAMGRLIGTILSGFVFQQFGLLACLGFSFVMLLLAGYFVNKIPTHLNLTQ